MRSGITAFIAHFIKDGLTAHGVPGLYAVLQADKARFMPSWFCARFGCVCLALPWRALFRVERAL
jgi:hypothetical protein